VEAPNNAMEMSMEKRPNRSDRYQPLFHEIMYSHDMMSGFSNSNSISSRLCPYQYDERLLDLQDQLRKEFWRVVDEALNDKQSQMIKMIGMGATQMEVAKAMEVNQSSVNKNLHGGVSKSNASGGIQGKLKEACFSDPKIRDILKRIDEIREEKW
jgi:DNA-binding CsgD family transcriptional regulator